MPGGHPLNHSYYFMDDIAEEEFEFTPEEKEREKRKAQLVEKISQEKFDDAIDFANTFEQMGGERASAFKLITVAALENNFYDIAKKIALHCLDQGDDETYAQIFEKIAIEQAHAGLFEDARRTADEIKDDPYWKDSAYAGIVGALAHAGKMKECLELMNVLSLDSSQRPYAYMEIVKEMVLSGISLDEIHLTIEQATGSVSKDYLYLAAGKALKEEGRTEEVHAITEYISDPGVRRQLAVE